jgi:hypothetical protein
MIAEVRSSVKIRLMGDAIRLRLTQEEVASLAQGGPVESLTRFAGGALMFVVEPHELNFEAHYAVGQVTIMVPRHLVTEWAESADEGLYQDQPLNAGSLRIAIEKDYACLHKPAGPDNAGAYPNPGAKAQ